MSDPDYLDPQTGAKIWNPDGSLNQKYVVSYDGERTYTVYRLDETDSAGQHLVEVGRGEGPSHGVYQHTPSTRSTL